MKTLFLLIFQLFIFFSAPNMAISTENAPLKKEPREMIEVLGCMGCHKINGKGSSLASDLALVSSRKTAEQIKARLIADPASRKKAFMPSYQSLSEQDLNQISIYLYNLK